MNSGRRISHTKKVSHEESKNEDSKMDEHDVIEEGTETIPNPRANTSSCFIEGKVYIFGGHGGYGYQRKAFNDFWSFDVETGVWEKLKYKNNPCEARGGHSIFAIGHKIYSKI